MAIDHPIISLFSGAMGLDLGLEAAGFRTAIALEVNKQAVDTIKKNKCNLPVIHKRIEDVPTQEILKAANLEKGEPCVVTGGPCCQSFSTAGKRGSISDNRGNLFRHFIRVVSEGQPRFFVMENVKGLLSAAVKHRKLNERTPAYLPLSCDEQLGSALKVIVKELVGLNYYVVWGLLNCADYGVPQKRMRVVFIGSRDGEDIEIPKSTHAQNCADGLLPWNSLRRAIGRLKDLNPEYLRFTPEKLKLLRMLKAGQNWSDLPKRFHEEALGAAYGSWGGRCGFCRRLDWEMPSPTLTTSPDGKATTLCHPTELRPLSIREYAKLQQFPNKWQFVGSTRQKYTQIGNAVPVGLGAAIGKMLMTTMSCTCKYGLPADFYARLGQIDCVDKRLEERLKTRPKTQLHPWWLLKDFKPEEIHEWLEQAA